MNTTSKQVDAAAAQEVCTIVVLYDGNVTRARAMVACNYLVQQFWTDIELKFHWWRTDFLRDPTLAAVAAENAVVADFLIIATEAAGGISPALESWFETWLARRKEREGALVDLRPAASACSIPSEREQFLREICQRGNFDYLAAIPDGVDQGGNHRVVDEILDESRPPSHYGLNE